jgi:nicotinamidase-related amidase
MNAHVVIIDPQVDFCSQIGSLFVTGADIDMKMSGQMIDRLGTKISKYHVTLDNHHWVHVAHPVFWIDNCGNHPNPFTIISNEDVVDGKWKATKEKHQPWAIEYTRKLKNNGRYPLCIWPPHCIIGTLGANISQDVMTPLLEWENKMIDTVDFIHKGTNWRTEHYSAIQADISDDITNDPSTFRNDRFLMDLADADIIGICGEALSHCVANTVRDIADNFGEENVKKIVLLQDASSNVPGFEQLGNAFIQDLTKRGMQLGTTTDFLV